MDKKQQHKDAKEQPEQQAEAAEQTQTTEPSAGEQELSEKLNLLALELNKEKQDRMQLLADFVNYRKRTEKDKEDMRVTANKALLQQIIEIIDDFDRAINQDTDEKSEFYKGIIIIQKKLSDLLNLYGLKQINAEAGADFDPATMEAVTTAPAPEPKLVNKILQVVGKGYVNQNGQVFKPVRVVIARKA